ncbi:uncharacterized protein [Aegilops tauschii subsp. strangulata]|uniref:uncharacterized protein n=1 Tax=Aegilops tauschii subsp. strangulata TaxID=200361 RepID=UPI00098A82F8|nr:uncharacterized protein LOC109766526 [Aegilops tauschii subsp. strangulata]
MAAASNTRCIQEVEQQQEDRLSKLPDDILLSSQSLLARRDQRQAVRALYLRFYLGDESVGIVRAVDDAMARGCSIAKATFVILGEKMDIQCTDEDLAGHAARFLSCLDACPRAFAGLTALHVESVKLGQSDINNLLGTWGRLKSLSLLNCDSGRDTALVVQHPRIAVLKLVTCGTIQLRWLPELVKLTCECWLPSRDPLLFGHVPRLRTLALATNCTSDYKILRLSELLDKNATLWIQPEAPKQLAPRLSNLRILNLQKIPEECGIKWTFFLLDAAPLLEELDIEVSNHQCNPLEDEMLRERLVCKKTFIEWEPSDFKRYNLAVLTIYGFRPEKMFMGYITRIMEVAISS